MAVTPQNTTGTLWVDYSWRGGEHSFQLHHSLSASLSQITELASQFLAQLQPVMSVSWTVTGLRYRAAGSNVSLPAGTILVDPGPITDAEATFDPRFFSFIGRSNTGKRTRISIYGLQITTEPDYRLEIGDEVALDAARGILAASPAVVSAVDGSAVSWYSYYNWGWNAYIQRRQRRTG